MTFRYISKIHQKEWETLAQTNPASGFMQSFFWADFKRSLGAKTFKIGIFKEKKLVGGTIIFKYFYEKSKNFLYIPEGPVIPYEIPEGEKMFDNLMMEINKIADFKGKTRTSHIQIEPRLKAVPSFFNTFQKAPYNLQPMHTLMIDLCKSEQTLLSEMTQKCRYNIKVAIKHGITIKTEASQDGIKKFLKLYEETKSRKNFTGSTIKYFEHLLFFLLKYPSFGTLFFANFGDEPLACGLVIFFGNRITYLAGASSSHHREKMASYLLHWEIIRYAKKHGFKWYDFWGISPPGIKNHPWQGLTEFKKKFGGESEHFIGAYDFIYNKKLYLLLHKQAALFVSMQ